MLTSGERVVVHYSLFGLHDLRLQATAVEKKTNGGNPPDGAAGSTATPAAGQTPLDYARWFASSLGLHTDGKGDGGRGGGGAGCGFVERQGTSLCGHLVGKLGCWLLVTVHWADFPDEERSPH